MRGTLILSVSAAGEAAASQRAVIAAQVGGRIATLPVREGQMVRAGQRVVTLDVAEHLLAVQEAQAALRDAEAKYREITIFDDRIADEAVRRDRAQAARARSGVETAEVRVRRAQLEMERTRILAPFSGRAAYMKAVQGQWVRQGDELMTVVALDPMRIEVQVLESEVGQLTLGGAAHVTFSAFPGESFHGTIQTINPVVDAATRTARVTVLVPNPQGRILPGMYARVSLDARRLTGRLLVPRPSLVERDRRTLVFVFDGADQDGVAKWRYVTPGLQNDTLVELLAAGGDSVAPGEIVLTKGHLNLNHDARVRLVGHQQIVSEPSR